MRFDASLFLQKKVLIGISLQRSCEIKPYIVMLIGPTIRDSTFEITVIMQTLSFSNSLVNQSCIQF